MDKAIKKVRDDIAQLELESTALERLRPHPKPSLPTSKLRLKVQDLSHPGAKVFFANSNPTNALSKAIEAVLSTLYEPANLNRHIPPTRSVTLILRPMVGVAYTTSVDMDDDHKEIHFSLNYIHDVSKRLPQPGQSGAEIQGVILHEMVHCWQWNGLGTAPSGLIEGIADFVRLKAGLSPPQWRKGGAKWDAGYQTTAYFLEWVEDEMGVDSVRKINQALETEKYDEQAFWRNLFGKDVEDLWNEYLRSIGQGTKEAKPEREKGSQSIYLAKEVLNDQDQEEDDEAA